MSKSLKIILIIVGVLVIVAVVAGLLGSDKGIEVKTARVEIRTVVETISGSGKIEPEKEVKISSEISGQVVKLFVKEGQFVEAGEELVYINPDTYQSAVNRASAGLNTARSQHASAKARLAQSKANMSAQQAAFDRSKSLVDQGAISQAEFDTATAQYEGAKADLEAAEQSVKSALYAIRSAEATQTEANDNLTRTVIKAPQAGTITALKIEEGESILGTGMMQGTELMRVSDLSTMEVNVEINETDIIRVHLGDTAQIEVDAYLDEEFLGIVTEISNTANNSGIQSLDQVTNFDVKVRVMEESYKALMEKEGGQNPFRSGMSATVEIRTDVRTDVLTVPIAAVTTRVDTASTSLRERLQAKRDAEESGAAENTEPVLCVFVMDGSNKVKLKTVTTGAQDNRFIEIESGLEEDDEVVKGPDKAVTKLLANGKEVSRKNSSKKKEE